MIPQRILHSVKSIETKNDSIYNHGVMPGFTNYLLQSGEHDLAAYQLIKMYETCQPQWKAIDIRGTAFSNLTIKVWDKKAKAYLEQEHDILGLLDHPNNTQSQSEFLKGMASFWDILGNVLVKATAMNNKQPPKELFNISPVGVVLTPSTQNGTAGFAGQYTVVGNYDAQQDFVLDDDSDRFRYYDGDNEIWHGKTFNPFAHGNNLWGIAPTRPIFVEIESFVEANITNYSSLKQGMRPSGVFTAIGDEPLSDKQWDRLQEQASKYSGSKGTGKVWTADGVKFDTMSQSNRDYQFQELQESLFQRISYQYDIPLSMLTTDAQTFDNLNTARYMLYDTGITPLADRMLQELTAFLMPRYKNSENLILRFDRAEVDELKLRALEEAEKLRTIAATTENEIRSAMGYEELKTPESQNVFKPSQLVVFGGAPALSPTPVTNPDTAPVEDIDTDGKVVQALLRTKNSETGKLYTIAEIRAAFDE